MKDLLSPSDKNYVYRRELTPAASNYLSCPKAFDWYTNSSQIPDWGFVPSNVNPQPGFVVARPDKSESHGFFGMWQNPYIGIPTHYAHVGILDYDGSWISAGTYTVNKFAHLTQQGYQPVGLRKYSGS